VGDYPPLQKTAGGQLLMNTSVYGRTLQKAAELAGGHKKLARYLRVPLSDLEKWIAGTGKPPIGTFLKAVDLVLDETPSPSGTSEPGDPAPPRECGSLGDTSAML
jgi:hypothetical protein